MTPDDVQVLLQNALADCDVAVSGAGSHFEIRVVGELFSGLRPVQRQQKIYAVLQQHIAEGAIHAVNIKTYTPDEVSK
ncbi:BolA family protein [Porticoccus sp.]|uniref:BolA family protein n=1 Tax=Porticoccus sp. TaxID=2024853 RepID=UPI003F69502F